MQQHISSSSSTNKGVINTIIIPPTASTSYNTASVQQQVRVGGFQHQYNNNYGYPQHQTTAMMVMMQQQQTQVQHQPQGLLDLCCHTILKHFGLYKKITLPDELMLKLTELLIKRRKLNDITLAPFLNPSIRTLDLSNCQNVNIQSVLKKCPNLKALCLRGCLTVSDVTLTFIAQSCTNLTQLVLTYNKKVTDNGMKVLTQHCTKIEELDVSWCSRLTDRTLEEVAKNCTNLRELSSASCKHITGEGVRTIAKLCSGLKKLELRGCNKVEHLEIISASLKILNLSNCLALVEDSIQNIHCPSLQELYFASCVNLQDQSIGSLMKTSQSLSHLDLSFCNIEEANIASNRLTHLHLSGCKRLKPTIYKIIAIGCPNLKEIDLRGCSSTTDDCIDHLTAAKTISSYSVSPKRGQRQEMHAYTSYVCGLEHINLSRCESITDKSVQYLTERCYALKSLDVSWCPTITDTSLRLLAYYFTNRFSGLQALKIFGCSQISSNAIQNLQSSCPPIAVRCIMNPRDWSQLDVI